MDKIATLWDQLICADSVCNFSLSLQEVYKSLIAYMLRYENPLIPGKVFCKSDARVLKFHVVIDFVYIVNVFKPFDEGFVFLFGLGIAGNKDFGDHFDAGFAANVS